MNFSILRRKHPDRAFLYNFEKDLKKGPLGKNEMNYEILQLSAESRYFETAISVTISKTIFNGGDEMS